MVIMKRGCFDKNLFFVIILLSVIVSFPLHAQFPRLNFKSFTEKEGLSTNYVRSICEDRDGFMWFGTPNGLEKFNGKDFINYNKLLQDTLSGNYQISYDILEDKEGILWIATYSNGIILFDKNRETITRLKHDRGNSASLSNDRVLDVYEGKDGNIWIATAGGGLDLWQRDHKNFKHFRHDPADPNSIGSNYISSVSGDSRGNIWVLSLDGIVSKFDPKEGKFKNIILPLKSHDITIRRGITQVIYVDSDDHVLAGTYSGLFIINPQTGDIKLISEFNPDLFNVVFLVTSILEIQKGIIAIATSFQGLYLFNISTGEFVSYSNDLNSDYYINSNSITSIYKSRNGLIWLGSWDAGVNMYNQEFSQFQMLKDITKSGAAHFTGTRGAAFCASPDHKIWIATGDKEIVAYDPINKTAELVLKNVCRSTVTCLHNGNKGEIFIGTADNGLMIYDFWKNSTKILSQDPKNPNSIASNYIYFVLQDKDNKLWISFTGSGLDVWDRSTDKITHHRHDAGNPNSLISDVVYMMMEDRTGRIWIGTQNGLCYYDKDKKIFTHYPLFIDKKHNIQLNTILDIFEDSKGIIWVGTNRALFRLNPDDHTSTVLMPKNEIPYLITNIMEDLDHNIWMTSYNKLFKLNQINNEFTVYNFYNGITTPSFLGYSSLSSKGQFYLGSLDRIFTFNPADIVDDMLRPNIFVTDLRINNIPVTYESSKILTENINFTKSIKLDFRQSTFSFTFAALEYSFPDKIQYAYKLENFDKDWIYTGNQNRATYTRVPPGKYIFRVRATNRQGNWFESDQQIRINIKPSLWETLGFRVFALLLVFAAILGIYSLRVRKLRQQKKKLEEIVKLRTSDLNEANISLSEQHEELKQQNDLLSEMSQKILKQNKELEMHYGDLERLVDERTLELKVARNKAVESDMLKSAFLANMSHEIRTPMNAIVGFTTLLKDESLSAADRNEYIEIVNSNSNTLLMLINDILDLSMIEANQLIIRKEVMGVNELLDHLYSTFSLLNNKKNLSIRLNNELHNQEIQINSDNLRIKQILSNLLSNALKFTNEGVVELGLRMNGKYLAFYVKDTGIGIQENDIETVFERFRKSEADDGIIYRGVGLGLSISRALAQLLGGNLTVESVFGKGSVFTFQLPVTEISNESPVVLKMPVVVDAGSNDEKNILVVEDEIANFMYLNKMLAKSNLKVFRAENGLEALKLLESGKYFPVILMDIKMPKMDGFEATKIIKSKNPDQIVIAVTAYARQEERLKFMEAGFNDYLTKPIKPDEFRSILRKYIS